MRERPLRPGDRNCPLCKEVVPGGHAFPVLAKHFSTCPVLRPA
jgi:hypothetical protein